MSTGGTVNKLAKRFVAVILTVILVIPSVVLSAVPTVTDSEGYIIINTAAELDSIRDNTAGKFRLYSDIDLTDYVSNRNTAANGWYPIGYGSPYFRGELDGNGHTISGLWSGSGWGISYKGLFSVTVGAVIKNLNVVLAPKGITGGYEVGAITGDARNGTLIDNCAVSGGQIIVTGGGYAGGLVGYAYGSPSVTIRDCTVADTYTRTSGNYSGGLVGVAKNAAIIRSKAVNTVSEGYSYIGGAVGGILGETSLTDVYSSGTVKATASYAGGLVGVVYGASSISGGYATGSVNASHYAGGLVGTIYEHSILFKCCAYGNVTSAHYIAGGLVGEAVASTISNCYAQGDVKGTTGVGGLVGYFSGSGASNNKSVENCYSSGKVTGTGTTEYGAFNGRSGVKYLGTNYYDGDTADAPRGYGTSGSPTGGAASYPQSRTTVNMMKQATFVGWDFENIWKIDEDETYPYFDVFWGTPKLDIGIDGELKVNRKLTVWGTSTKDQESYDRLVADGIVSILIVPVSSDTSPLAVRIDDETELADFKELIFKQAGEYEITLTLEKGSKITTVTKSVTIVEDEAPSADFSVDDEFYRESDGEAHIWITDLSESLDGDTLGKRVWTVVHDANNNGDFSDDDAITAESYADALEYIAAEPGFYQAELKVSETYTNTITKFLTDDDYLSAISASKVFEVQNYAPSVSGGVAKSARIDLVTTFGDISDDRKDAFKDALKNVQQILAANGVDARLGGVESQIYTATDTFAWEIYEHENYYSRYIGTRSHSVVWDGDDMQMLGYNSEAYKDFLYLPDAYSGEKTFTFDLIRDRTDWHSMEGGGFLFNTLIENNTIQGYCILVTQSGLKLVKINRVNLTNFLGGSYNNVQNAGQLLGTVAIGDPYAQHSFKIVVSPTNISVWDGTNLVIDNYLLPAESTAYGFGPITSHVSHSCQQISYFTFTDLRMETNQSLTLPEALNMYGWNNSGARALLHISDGYVPDFADSAEVGRTAETILQKDLFYIAVSGDESEEQFSAAASAVDGIVIDGGDMDAFVTELANALLDRAQADAAINPGVYTTDDVLTYPYTYSDPENDPQLSEAFRYDHDPSVFALNLGEIDDNGVYGGVLANLPKPGSYDVYLKANDAPSDNPAILDAYSKWSDEAYLGSVLIHRRPVALLDVSLAADPSSPTRVDLSFEDHSYDPDHAGESGDGIADAEWKWKVLGDDDWTTGQPPSRVLYENEYLVVYRVQDLEGEWSYPSAHYLSTIGMTPFVDDEPPVIDFDISKNIWTVGEIVVFETSAADNDEVEFFGVYLNGGLVSTGYGRQTFTTTGPGEVIIEVVAKDFAGNESRYSTTVSIVEIDRIAPQIVLHYPTAGIGDHPGDTVDFIATITDNAAIESWTLEYRPEDGSFILINSGNDAVENDVIGTLDLSGLDAGEYEFMITAVDTSGNTSWLTFALTVTPGETDTIAPTAAITSPAHNSEVGGLVTVVGTAADETALASYTLKLIAGSAETIIVSGTAAVSAGTLAEWDTTDLADGVYQLELSAVDEAGNRSFQRVTVYVKNTGNDITPPAIEFVSPLHGDVVTGFLNIVASASDSGGVQSYELAIKPVNGEFVTVASGTGNIDAATLFAWNTAALTDGTHALRLTARDTIGNMSSLTIYVFVSNGNSGGTDVTPPTAVIVSPVNGAAVSGVVSVTGTVVDETALSGWLLEIKPQAGAVYEIVASGAAVIDGVIAEWDASGLDEGFYDVRLTVTDSSGNWASSSISVEVKESEPDDADYEKPVVSVVVSSNLVNAGSSVTILAQATDDDAVEYIEVFIDGEQIDGTQSWATVTQSANAILITYTPSAVGNHIIEVFAADASGNIGKATAAIRAINPSGSSQYLINLAADAGIKEISQPTTIYGTAAGAGFSDYELKIAPTGTTYFRTLAASGDAVADGYLGEIDTTTLENGLYDLVLVVNTANGGYVTITDKYLVTGDLKVGAFTLTFEDMVIPVTSLPFSVFRTYDSRRKDIPGDFGYGWTFSSSDFTLTKNHTLGDGWTQTSSGGIFPTYRISELIDHDIVVRYPNGDVDRFSMKLDPSQQQLAPLQDFAISFEATPGTTSTLQMINPPGHIYGGYGAGEFTILNSSLLNVFDCNQFQLTTKEGAKYRFNNGRIYEIEDVHGNLITITTQGIQHSDGQSVTFTRNAQNRIIRVQEGVNYLVYGYDYYGDLVTVTDANGNVTRFVYDADHNIAEIIDPRGVRATRNEYDSAGRLTASIDVDGNRIEYEHDLAAGTSAVRDPRGYQTVYAYDAAGNVISVTDPYGNSSSATYDAKGDKLTSTDKLGNTTIFNYDDNGNLVKVTSPTGVEASMTYSSSDRLLTIADLENTILTYTYNADGELATSEDGGGNVQIFTYNEIGLATSLADQIGTKWSFTFDSAGRTTSMTDGAGSTVSFAYDAYGRNTSKTKYRTTENGVVSLTEFYTYDAVGNIVQIADSSGAVYTADYNEIGKLSAVADPLGNQTLYEYDRLGRLSKTVYPDGSFEEFFYDASGNNTKVVDRAGRSIEFEFDKLDRLTKVDYPNGSYKLYSYDANGSLLSYTNQLGGVTLYEYNASNQNTAVIDPLGNRTEFDYNNRALLSKATDAKGAETSYLYDANGNLTKVVFDDGTFIETEYDARSRVVKETDQDGNQTSYAYDGADFLTSVTNALGGVYSYSYDDQANLVSVADPNGHITSYDYDAADRLVKVTRPLGMYSEFAYDAAGRLTQATDFNGDVTDYVYDSMGRVVQKITPDAEYAYTYSANGLPLTVTGPDGTLSYQYDTMNGLVKKTNADGSAVEYEYDLAGDVAQIKATTSGGIAFITGYAYDVMGRLIEVTAGDGSVTEYGYDANGNRSAVQYPNGVTVSYQYDALNRLVEQTTTGLTGGSASAEYTLSASGERLLVVENGKTTEYTYDELHRLVVEEITITDQTLRDSVLNDIRGAFGSDGHLVIEYEYDAVGNRLAKVENSARVEYSYDANDRLLAEGAKTYSYDDNGSLVGKVDGSETTAYVYDGENRLMSVRVENGQELTIEKYDYDAAGSRIRATANEVTVTNYLVDDNGLSRVLVETDAAGEVTAEYTHGFEIISMNRDGETSYYVFDGQGSVRALADETGAVTDTYGYDAFGQLIHKTGVTDNAFLYRGEQLDANSGFYYLRARYMDPATGRFVTTDPYAGSVYDPASLHKYTYAGANPVMNSDPTGLFTLGELNASAAIQGVLDKIATMRFLDILKALRQASNIIRIFMDVRAQLLSGEPLSDILAKLVTGYIMGQAISGLAECSMAIKLLAGTIAAFNEISDINRMFEEGDYAGLAWKVLDIGLDVTIAGMGTCFDGDTLVLTDDGAVRIDEIEVGNRVLSFNFETGEAEYKEVTEVFVNETYELLALTVGGDTIDTTAGHPFYVEGRGFVEAGELRVGDVLVSDDGELLPLDDIGIVRLDEPIKVYNLLVEGNHNYFVADVGILVHNACGKVTNKDGRRGGVAHQQKITDTVADLKAAGYSVGTEAMIRTPGGNKNTRFADIIATDPTSGETWYFQIGLQTQAGNPVSREVKALSDIINIGGMKNSIFIPYN